MLILVTLVTNYALKMDRDTSVKVAVRIRPLNSDELQQESSLCLDTVPNEQQVLLI